MKKVLFTAKVDSHIEHFHLPYLEMFKKKGYEVHVASEGNSILRNCDEKFDLKFGKNPFSKSIIDNYRKLKEIMDKNDYDIIHTHTAIASVLTRISAYFSNKHKDNKSKVIYTAHGFQFVKCGPIKDWLLYFPVELIMGKITDILLLINHDDYKIADKFSMAKERILIDGVGLNLVEFDGEFKKIDLNNPVVSYIAELNDNKNQKLLIDAVQMSLEFYPNLKLQLIGSGDNMDCLKKIIYERQLEDNVFLLGYRKNVPRLLSDTSIVVSTSKREGLPMNIIEAMSMAKPIIVTKCRGHVDLIKDGINGFIVDYNAKEISLRINQLLEDEALAQELGNNAKLSSKKYDINQIKVSMKKIYGLDE